MSDRSAAEIRIGGDVDREKLLGLFNAAQNDNAGPEWEGGPGDDVEEFFSALPADPEPLVLRNNEVAGGTLDTLEEFCRDNGLTYVRQTAAHYAYDAELAWWKPGMAEPASCATNERGEPLLRAEDIDEMLRDATSERTGHIDAGVVFELREFLDENTPPTVPPLRLIGAAKPRATYHATGTYPEGEFSIDVQGVSPADAFVEVGLSLHGNVAVRTLTDATGRDVLADIDPRDPVL